MLDEGLPQERTLSPLPLGRLGLAAVILGAGIVGSRLLGLLRDIVISKTFGTSAELDAYYAAFRLPDLVFQLVAGAALVSAFLPTFTGLLLRSPQEAWQVASTVLNLLLGITALMGTLAILLAPWLLPWIAPGFSPEQHRLATGLAQIMLIGPVFFSASGIITGILNARQHFLMPALAPWAYNLSIILCALFFAGTLGVQALALGVTLGAFLHLLVQVPVLARLGMRYRLTWDWRHPGVREILRLMAPRTLGLAAVQVNFLVTTVLASMLATGSLSALNLAWPLVMVPLGVFGLAIATASFPTMAQQVALERQQSFRNTLVRGLCLILFLTIPAAVGLMLLREPIVTVVYQRGGFGAASTQAVAWALLFYALGLPAHAALEMVTRAFYALKDTMTPVVVGIGAMLLTIILSLILVRFLHHGGLALSLSLATTGETATLLFLLRQRLGAFAAGELLVSLTRTLAATGIMAFIVGGLLVAFPLTPQPSPPLFVALSFLIVLGVAAYGLAAALLGSPDLTLLWATARSWRRPSS